MATTEGSHPSSGYLMTIPEITKKAEDFEYNPHVPLRYWLRTADTLLKEAQIYEREGDDQQAYLLLFRHAKLVLDYLSHHPQRVEHENRLALEAATKALPKTVAKLERLKPRINQRRETYEKLVSAVERSPSSPPTDGAAAWQHGVTGRAGAEDMPGSARSLPARDNRDLAVRIAHQELRRRETARKATRQAGLSAEEEHERRVAGIWGNWEQALAHDKGFEGEDEQQRRMRETRRRVDTSTRSSDRRDKKGEHSPSHAAYRYPSVPKRDDSRSEEPPPYADPPLDADLPSPAFSDDPRNRPARPPKGMVLSQERIDGLGTWESDERPPLPSKAPLGSHPPASRTKRDSASSATAATAASASAAAAASSFTFQPAAYLENGTPLRTVFLPPTLRTTFLTIADANTRANLETCGILCGTLISNALFISRLVIPEQESTSDTCETVNESALFDYCDSEDLMVLGWIHTHPSQTCFMSSRDLHTHCGYQVMMPESIAIVCAPSKSPS
ncbi:MAG: hypothetical protein M1838_002257 [Thelocarpon superellum]|nr:MAG: hypothetical protein M1838_002257 [Thelocarpon superellum]